MSDHDERIGTLRSKFEELEHLVRARLESRTASRLLPEPPVRMHRVQEKGFRALWKRLFGGREVSER